MTAEWVAAISSIISAVAAVVMIAVAVIQLRGLRNQIEQATNQIRMAKEQEIRQNTLLVVQRIESDPEIKEAMAHIWTASSQGKDYSQLNDSHMFDVATLLNYLQGVAVGIRQNVYIDSMAKDFLDSVLQKSVKAFIYGESGDGWKGSGKVMYPKSDFRELCELYDQWFPLKKAGYDACK